MTVDEDAENLRIDVDVETVVCAGCGGGCTSMCAGLVLFALLLVVVVCRKQRAARKIVTVDEDRKFASPDVSMSVRISKDAEDLASRVVVFVVDRSRSIR